MSREFSTLNCLLINKIESLGACLVSLVVSLQSVLKKINALLVMQDSALGKSYN